MDLCSQGVQAARGSQVVGQSIRLNSLDRNKPIAPTCGIASLNQIGIMWVCRRSERVSEQCDAAITPATPFPISIHKSVHRDIGIPDTDEAGPGSVAIIWGHY